MLFFLAVSLWYVKNMCGSISACEYSFRALYFFDVFSHGIVLLFCTGSGLDHLVSADSFFTNLSFISKKIIISLFDFHFTFFLQMILFNTLFLQRYNTHQGCHVPVSYVCGRSVYTLTRSTLLAHIALMEIRIEYCIGSDARNS